MLPPLFEDNNREISPTVSTAVVELRPAAESSYKTLSTGLWLISGVTAVVFGGLLLLVVGLFSMDDSLGGEVTLSGRMDPSTSGKVFGSWIDQYSGAKSTQNQQIFDESALLAALERVQREHPDHTMSVVVAPVGEGEQVRLNSDWVTAGASTTKVLTAAAVLQRIDQSKLSMNSTAYMVTPKTTPTPTASAATESTEEREEVKVEEKPVSVELALRMMINRSDNVAWEHLIKLIGSKNLQAFADQIGMKNYNVRNNDVSADNMALFLQKMYRGEVLSEASLRHLLSLMQRTNEERMIPSVIDEAGEVYHKYGWIGQNVHDVAIVDNNGQPVVVVIMTQGKDSYDKRIALVREIAEKVEQALVDGATGKR